MRYYENENDNLLEDINSLLGEENLTPKVELQAEDEEVVLIPLRYHIFYTLNGEPNGKREPIDTYECDRVRGITPIGKARAKADLMKKAFANRTFFVEETSSKIVPNKPTTTVKKIVHQTN